MDEFWDYYDWGTYLEPKVLQLSNRGAILFGLYCCERLRSEFANRHPDSDLLDETVRAATEFIRGSRINREGVHSLWYKVASHDRGCSPANIPLSASCNAIDALLECLEEIADGREGGFVAFRAASAGNYALVLENCRPSDKPLGSPARFCRWDGSLLTSPPGEMRKQTEILDEIRGVLPKQQPADGAPTDPAPFLARWVQGTLDWSRTISTFDRLES